MRTIKATTGAKVDDVVEEVDERTVVRVEETAAEDVVLSPKETSSTQPHDATNKTTRIRHLILRITSNAEKNA
jgi:hypothetical protein